MLNKKVIIYDSECITCDSFVKWIIKKDKKQNYIFSSRDNEKINKLKKLNYKFDLKDTIIVLDQNKKYYYSDAIILILSDIVWKGIGFFRFIPKILRDTAYRIYAKFRPKSKHISCSLDNSNSQRFI
ncbi:thiol-disulfide oxidoreductase DCC family protein [Staphylococcus xylosus]|uniref:thiol-disulfide oxidoreductase DCC family protein n=1 Tax=Staphylococcus xylosus TaxID=1288 RepID=UPI002DBE595C|nr:DCC1-like thiol-disulfide oxidoreductase family protein [Staphylococcus xylosus]MEB7385060.1 DCC1-like thiol-disulfide oxidoreductase family protein [Staphylococcus xylosus]MEB7832567.1 DCC1-like thiol-disulfide oxidoreductase family protein [Staphylococcus xylosus]